VNIQDVKTKPSLELILETEAIDKVLDVVIDYIKTLEQRIESLEKSV
jgi:hypothetical protein